MSNRLEDRVLRAAINWRQELKVKHEKDCGCHLCWRLGALVDKLILKIEREGRRIPGEELNCPKCDKSHVDKGYWARRPHSTHLCLFCGHEWRLDRIVRGIAPKFNLRKFLSKKDDRVVIDPYSIL